MPTNWATYPIKFGGGLVTNLGRIEQGIQAPGSATILQNFEPDIQGGYSRILGFSKFSTTAVTGAGQINGVAPLSATEVLVERGGVFYYSTGTTWTAKLTLTSAAIDHFHAETYNFNGTKMTVVVDEVNAPAYFNHTTKNMAYAVAPSSDVTGAHKVMVFKKHLFFSKGRLLSFTAPHTDGDFSVANGAGVINVGEAITGLAVFRNELIVFCLSSIHRLSGNSVGDFVLSPITRNTGCISGRTIQEVGGDIFYLGPDGVRSLAATERYNDFGLARISDKIQNDVLSMINPSGFYSSTVISAKNQYRLFSFSSATSTANSLGVIATSYGNQTAAELSWSTTRGMKVYAMGRVHASDKEHIMFCSDTGFIYRMESGNSFDGTDIEAIFETPYSPITDPKIRKTLYKHTLYARPSGVMSLTCTVKFDYAASSSSQNVPFTISGDSGVDSYGDASSVYNTSVYGAIGQEQYYNNLVGSGFVVALRYYSKSQSPTYNLNFAVLEYRQNERR